MDRIEEIQEKFLKDPLSSEVAGDYAFMLNTIYCLQDEIKEYEAESKSLATSVMSAQADLASEKSMHITTLDVLEKAMAELVSLREVAKARTEAKRGL